MLSKVAGQKQSDKRDRVKRGYSGKLNLMMSLLTDPPSIVEQDRRVQNPLRESAETGSRRVMLSSDPSAERPDVK